MPLRYTPTLTLAATTFNAGQVNDHLKQLALTQEPQIALAGRSNVGKSSLINALAQRKKLAKTSSTPGKTRSINFYHVEPGSFSLADLPGYGYARCSREERAAWAKLIDHYIKTVGTQLCGLALLIDSRLEPQRLDLELADYARGNGLILIPVLTKADKCKQRELAVRQKQWQENLDNIKPLAVSSATGRGIQELWMAILDRVGCRHTVFTADQTDGKNALPS